MRDAYSGTYRIDNLGTMSRSSRGRTRKSSFEKILESKAKETPKNASSNTNYKIKFEEYFNIVYDIITTSDVEKILATHAHRVTTMLVISSKNWKLACKEEYGAEPFTFILKNKSLLRRLSRAIFEIKAFNCQREDVADRYNIDLNLLKLCLNNDIHRICKDIAEKFISFRKEINIRNRV